MADQPAAGRKTIQAAVFFKEAENGHWRVSLRSKGEIDVGPRSPQLRRRRA
jgi:nanoRNase/pAp phosphatase (c-di-AMP/oligoRNAs hydrolase)